MRRFEDTIDLVKRDKLSIFLRNHHTLDVVIHKKHSSLNVQYNFHKRFLLPQIHTETYILWFYTKGWSFNI